MTPAEMWRIADHVWETAAREVTRLSEYLTPQVFSQVVTTIAGCTGRIVTSGCGTSAVAARKIAHSLSCIERPAFYLAPSDAVHGALGSVQPGDIAVLISKGGGTTEILAMVPALQAKGVTIIAVTEKPDSPLGRAGAIVVPVKIVQEADEFNMLATTSTMAVIAYFDAVCIALMRETGYSREQFAIIHPGGAVGERLAGPRQTTDQEEPNG